ncbi:MAG: lytic transglycosylase domain-containing protein [Clostridia bacterium]|nr:lytic transglycosylase domain-containing protein [Clostridia bacterium]
MILKIIYPLEYLEYVYKYSEEYDLDPLLSFAIIKAESNFDEKAVSTSNAVGLMQLLEKTAEEIAAQDLQMKEFYKEDLYNPETNIKIGLKYFSKLLKEYDYNYNLALAAYNAGTGNVKKWIEQGIINKAGENIEKIPFKETNNYVRKVNRNYKIYKDLYER